ncbi:MAG: hypothetical protein JXA30_05240 [Deltaproteobacteria bacterium]|nr:hypothetical protein [Deltaproteobacteria bacterium]
MTLVGCAVGGSSPQERSNEDNTPIANEDSTSALQPEVTAGGPSDPVAVSSGGTGVSVQDDNVLITDECAGVSARAEVEFLPTDVIWAIDTSGSMNASFPAIQQALNDFSQRVIDAGIDAHIILLAGAEPFLGSNTGLCVPPPLGSGQCGAAATPGGAAADSLEPGFLHLDLPFGMTMGIPTLLDNYESYKHLLRPNALTQFVMTEDGPPLQTTQQVIDHIEGRMSATFTPAWDPPLSPESWVFNGVICKDGIGIGTCILAFGVPVTTLELIEMTGGLLSNLDDAGNGSGQDPFSDLLDKLAEAVIVGAQVSCEYTIPEAPAGETFNRDMVNVIYSSSQKAPVLYPKIPDDKSCDDNEGWRYDDPNSPSKVILCPAACTTVQNDMNAAIDVKFGCETQLLII